MGFVNLSFLLIVASLSVLIFSKYEKDLAIVISSALYIIVAISTFFGIEKIINELKIYIIKLDFIDLTLLVKIAGLSIIATLSSSLCESAGQKGLAEIIELAVTIEILLMLLPAFQKGVESIANMLGG